MRELAVRSGVPTATVGGYLTARHLPGPSQLEQFRALLFHCGVDAPEDQQLWVDALLRVRWASDGRAGRRTAAGRAPYRGLQPFEAEDAALFFGRGEFVQLVVSRLARLRDADTATDDPSPPMLFLIGASGSGKSSVLRAGLLPAVARGALSGGGASGHAAAWHAAIITPGAAPLRALDAALDSTPEPRLVVIDQFEELYTLCGDTDARAGFVSRMAEARQRTLFVAGMRADFFAEAARDPRLVPALQNWQVVVPPMSSDDLRQVIVGPAQALGIAVEPALVDTVLSEVFPRQVPGATARQNALPLLSHALLSAWEHRRRGPLGLHDYLGAGGLAGAVQQSAETAYDELDPQQREVCRRLFLRLIAVDEDLVTTRRRAQRGELDELRNGADSPDGSPVAAVIERFVTRRLLTVDDQSVEISHEALLVAWSRLADWIAADHESLRQHRRITSAAHTWHDADFDDHLLLRGSQLTAAKDWTADPDHAADLNRLERDFLTSSVTARTSAQRLERRRTAASRAVTAALAVLLVVAVGMTVVALHARTVADRQRQAANTQRDQARSRQLAVDSQRAAATDLALAGQLALAAYRTSPTVDARSALFDALSQGVVSRLVGRSGPTATALNSAGTIEAISDAQNGTVSLHAVIQGRPRQTLSTIPARSPADQIFAIAFSPDGRHLALGGLGGAVRLVAVADSARPSIEATLPGKLGTAVQALHFSPDGQTLFAAGGPPGIRAWSIRSPRAPDLLPGPAHSDAAAGVQSLATDPRTGRLLAGTADGAVLSWALHHLGERPAHVQIGHSAIDFLAVSPRSSQALVGSKDATVTAVDITTPARMRVSRRVHTDFTSWANAAAYAPDGAHVALGSADGKIDILRDGTWSTVRSITDAGQVTALNYDSTGQMLIAASADGVVRSIPVGGRLLPALGGPAFSIGFARSSGLLATMTTGPHGSVATWSIRPSGTTAAGVLPLPASFGQPDGTGAIAPNGRVVAAGNATGQIVIDTLTRAGQFDNNAQLLSAGHQTIESVTFSPDSHLLAAGSDDGNLYLWNIAHPHHPVPLAPLKAGAELVSVSIASGSHLVAAASVDHTVHLWDVRAPRRPRELPPLGGFKNYAWSVAFSPDAAMLAAGGADNTIRLWNVTDPSRAHLLGRPFVGPTHYVFSLAFSPDSHTLAAAGGDSSVWTWALTDPSRPAVVATLHAANPGGGTYTVAYTPDGTYLAAAGTAGTVTFWNTDIHAAIAAECRLRGTALTRSEWRTYVPGAAYRDSCT